MNALPFSIFDVFAVSLVSGDLASAGRRAYMIRAPRQGRTEAASAASFRKMEYELGGLKEAMETEL